jgi:hypothetical protein
LGALEEFQRRYGKDVAYFVVYFEEAHPEDGWVLRAQPPRRSEGP